MIPQRDDLDAALDEAAHYFAPDGPYWIDAEIAAENAAREGSDRFEAAGNYSDAECDYDE